MVDRRKVPRMVGKPRFATEVWNRCVPTLKCTRQRATHFSGADRRSCPPPSHLAKTREPFLSWRPAHERSLREGVARALRRFGPLEPCGSVGDFRHSAIRNLNRSVRISANEWLNFPVQDDVPTANHS